MKDLLRYIKGENKNRDEDFKNKKKYGNVYFYHQNIYVKKGLTWYYFPLSEIDSLEILNGTRQLRQCCGAPIHKTRELLITTNSQEHIYLSIEEIEDIDSKKAMKLVEDINKINHFIKVINFNDMK